MVTKRAIYEFDSNINQLPYNGSPGTYYNWHDALHKVDENSVPVDLEFDSDGVPVQTNIFSFSWPQLDDTYSPVYLRYRVRNDQLSTQSNWSVPVTVNTAVRYAIYKRRIASEPKNWVLQEITKTPSVGPYQENWAGRVQYAFCIHHIDAVPAATEGLASETDFENPYVLFATDPTDSIMNTRPYVVINPDTL